MNLFFSDQRVIITAPATIPAMQGRSGVVERVIRAAGHLVDASRGDAAIVRMDNPANVPGIHFRYLMFYAAECSPLEPSI